MRLLHRTRTIVSLAAASTLLIGGAAFAQDCQSTLSAADAGVTRLNHNPRLFIMGTFQKRDAREQLRDLAYVSTVPLEGTPREVVSVLLNGGEGCFRPPEVPGAPIVAGREPRLMAAGAFNGDAFDDLVIVDGFVDPLNPSPTVRVLLGEDQGRFRRPAGVDVVPLGEGETPIALAVGRFRGPSEPVDLAVLSTATSGTAPRGVLRILFNNGSGEFTAGATPPLVLADFEPEAMVASDHFRSGGKVDLVIKEKATSGRRRILFLQNAGNATFPTKEAVDGAGSSPVLLMGALQTRDTAGSALDIITFDTNMTLRIFVNDGLGRFNRPVVLNENSRFAFAGALGFAVAPAEKDRPLQLITAAARHTNPDAPGMLVLTSDGAGHFEDPAFRAFRRIATPPEDPVTSTTNVFEQPVRLVPRKRSLRLSQGLVAQFLNERHGNLKPDLALVAQASEEETRAGSCTKSDEPVRVPQDVVSVAGSGEISKVCRNPSAALKCDDLVAFCKSRPVGGKCECACAPPDPPARPIGCQTIMLFRPVLVVEGNPFNRQ